MKPLVAYRTLLIIAGIFLGSVSLNAQQDPMYTQYMFNKMIINPAYAGSVGSVNIQSLYRIQWLSMEGAPRTFTLSVNGPVADKNMGWGVTVVNDRIGPVEQSMLYANYAYQLILNSGTLAFGLKAGAGLYSANLSSLHPHDSQDVTLVDYKRKILPNVGIGVFYYNDQTYVGFSAPHLIKNDLSVAGANFGDLRRHYFLMAGHVWEIGFYRNYLLKTSMMIRGTEGAPLSFDISGVFYMHEKLGLGLTYRHMSAISGLVQYYITPKFYLGFSYDYVTTALRSISASTYEFMLSYQFGDPHIQRIYSPRFF